MITSNQHASANPVLIIAVSSIPARSRRHEAPRTINSRAAASSGYTVTKTANAKVLAPAHQIPKPTVVTKPADASMNHGHRKAGRFTKTPSAIPTENSTGMASVITAPVAPAELVNSCPPQNSAAEPSQSSHNLDSQARRAVPCPPDESGPGRTARMSATSTGGCGSA